MRYTVLQKSLDIPPVEKLQAAFRAVPSLTTHDAFSFANDAYGILVKSMEAEEAHILQQALAHEGVETELVPLNALPELPPIKFVRQLDYHGEALMVFDPLGRSFPVPWNQVSMIAAGSVRLVEQKTIRWGYTPEDKGDNRGWDAPPEYTTREERNFRPLLEITLGNSASRLQLQADKAFFRCLGERQTRDEVVNFTLLVRDLLQHAPHALVNRGAFYLREEPPQLFGYPSKNAFYEEMIWLQWRLRQQPPAPPPLPAEGAA
jgi:hypothetical protein